MIPDLRTTALAVAAWVGTAVGWWGGVPAVGAVLLAVAAVVVLGRRSTTTVAPVVVVLLGAVAVGAVSAHARETPPEVVGRTVEVTASVTGAVRQVAVDPGRAPAVLVPATVTVARAGAAQWDLSLPARVFIDHSDLPDGTLAGSVIAFHGRLAVRESTDAEIAVVPTGSVRLVADPGVARSLVNSIGGGLRQTLIGADPDAAGLVAGIALGDESGQSPQLAAAMRDSGLAHLTAVSGGNFVIVMAAALLITRALRGAPTLQAAIAGAVVGGYAVLVGAEPSVVRAAAMAAVGLLGVVLGGVDRGLPVLSACVTVLLLASPELAWSLGFALSVIATAGLQVFAPVVLRVMGERVPATVALPLAVTVTAQLMTAPLLVAIGAPVSWVSVPANLAVGVLIAPITLLGLLTAVIAPLVAPLAALISVPAVLCGHGVVLVARFAQQVALSPAGRDVGRFLLIAAVAGAVWGAVVRALGRRAATATATLAALVTLALGRLAGPPGDWRMVVCDVGQGTAVAVRTGASSAVLVDTGPARGDPGGCLAQARITRLDGVVVTHYHADHVAALPQVLAGNPGTPLWATTFARPESTVADLERLSGTEATALAAGDVVVWGDVTATVLWPPRDYRGTDDDANNGSLVLAVQWPDGFTALIPGDVEPESQTRIMTQWAGPGFDAVVIPHHGSDHQQAGFAQWATADDGGTAAIASSGRGNTYGHPAEETLTEYGTAGADVRRTDSEGSVFVPDGR